MTVQAAKAAMLTGKAVIGSSRFRTGAAMKKAEHTIIAVETVPRTAVSFSDCNL